MNFHNFFLLPHLLAKHIASKKLLVDYWQSYIVRFVEYLTILQNKIMDKVVVEQIIGGRWNGEKIGKKNMLEN